MFYWCADCFTVQSAITDDWRREIEEIYRGYDTYAAAGGVEQMSADQEGTVVSRRSDLICSRLSEEGVLGSPGTLLDVGCGRGAFLRAFAGAFPGTKLHGFEIDDRYRNAVEALPGGAVFHTAELQSIDVEADVVSLIHVLEHIENPVQFLGGLRRFLKTGGHVLVQVPSWQ